MFPGSIRATNFSVIQMETVSMKFDFDVIYLARSFPNGACTVSPRVDVEVVQVYMTSKPASRARRDVTVHIKQIVLTGFRSI